MRFREQYGGRLGYGPAGPDYDYFYLYGRGQLYETPLADGDPPDATPADYGWLSDDLESRCRGTRSTEPVEGDTSGAGTLPVQPSEAERSYVPGSSLDELMSGPAPDAHEEKSRYRWLRT
ncbi:MAG: hypothetical protein HN742_11160 [Lentisphaerae bacterium]|jgi:hypothetical protein|nr:hypothetical protein [Lentisphaerota bacterium]MBT4816096.1 hypothetical protein [Lentisphaerota bacterium]MBT5610512.1 hypothetical protein [Lentisphaerota bacterium]MBT7056067.1 hypothetical protein [Lentisphaerota bacterium]MBT7842424.1 hypothetical protein [Lentisphaerota bacterium]